MLPASPALAYQRVQGAVDEVATYAGKQGVTIGLETGQNRRSC